MSICALCEQPIIDGQHNLIKLVCPANHIFHLKCGFASIQRIYSSDPCECRICELNSNENNIVVPTAEPIDYGVPSYQDAIRLLDDKATIIENKHIKEIRNNVEREMDVVDARKIKEYVKHGLKVKRIENKMRKYYRQKIKDFKSEVEDLTRLYNNIFRKYYNEIVESNEVKEFQSSYRSWCYKHRRFNELVRKYHTQLDGTEYNFLRTLGYKNIYTFFHSRVSLHIWYALRNSNLDVLNNIKNTRAK